MYVPPNPEYDFEACNEIPPLCNGFCGPDSEI
jgi:hypothetical protein